MDEQRSSYPYGMPGMSTYQRTAGPPVPYPPQGQSYPQTFNPDALKGSQVLTQGGFNDGSEYSPDGKHIWFNSTRSGLMQLWRMNRDGSEQTQMTFSDRNNWFGHISPDGRLVTLLAYRKEDLKSHEHLPHKRVELRLMDSDGGKMKTLARFFGGQGTINVNSWSPDSRRFAYVRYGIRGFTEKDLEAITE